MIICIHTQQQHTKQTKHIHETMYICACNKLNTHNNKLNLYTKHASMFKLFPHWAHPDT